MSLLSICTNAADNVGVAAPSTIVGNTDPAAVRLFQLARRAGRSLARKSNWTVLITEHVFYANGTSDYALPDDFRSLVGDTLWDRSRYWRMRGAMSPQQWQMYKSSVLGRATIERRWRIHIPSGAIAGRVPTFSIDPSISSTDTSSQFVFEYVSANWCRDTTLFQLYQAIPVAAGSGYAVGDVIALAVAGAIPAVIVTSITSAGGVLTAEVIERGQAISAYSSPMTQGSTSGSGTGATFLANQLTAGYRTQSDWAADTDLAQLDEDLLELGVIWRLQERLGIAYAESREEYEREVDKAIARDGGTAILDLAPGPQPYLLSPWNVPETGFGA